MNPDEFKTTGKQLFTIRESGLMDDYEVNVAIDFDFPGVKEKIKEMSMFWGSHPPETDHFEEHLDFVLRLIASDVFYMKKGEGLNDYGVAKEFSEREGYYFPLDGSHGILVRSSHFPDIGMDTFEVGTQKEYPGSFEIKPPKW